MIFPTKLCLRIFLPCFILLLFISSCQNAENSENSKIQTYPPEGFVRIQKLIPGILIEARYHSEHNFIGKSINGYYSDSLILEINAAKALSKIQEKLKLKGYEIKLYDAYRPQKAVDHFVEWAKDLKDSAKKREFYPRVPKSRLFEEGYIAEKSGHSRGGTVDITLVYSHDLSELDMGSPYDFFDPISWPSDSTVSPLQYNNRMMLKTIMEENGFKSLDQEWWHFSLKNEKFPHQYFDFDIK